MRRLFSPKGATAGSRSKSPYRAAADPAPVAISSKVRRLSRGSAVAQHDLLPSHLPIVKEGWLYKRGGSHGGRTNWKRRWFLLIADVLYYMEGRSDSVPRGRVVLRDCDFRNAEEELRRPHSWGIYHLSNMAIMPFFCAADTPEEAAEWLNALQMAAQGQHMYGAGGIGGNGGGIGGNGGGSHGGGGGGGGPLPTSGGGGGEAALALSLIAQLVREHEPRRMPQAQLEVTVVEARGLAPMDRNGLSDPYCVLHCGAVRCQTRCIQKSLDPKWGETFRFEVAPHQSTQLQIDCFDHDIFSSDDFLGTFKLRIDDLLAEDWDDDRDLWFELQQRTARDAKVTGEVRLKIVVKPLEGGNGNGGGPLEGDGDGDGGDGDGGGGGGLMGGEESRRGSVSKARRSSSVGAMTRVDASSSFDAAANLPPETAVVRQVSTVIQHLQHLYTSSLQARMRLTEENNALKAGLRDLVSAPELAPFRARTSRLCHLTVSAIEARGIEQRKGGGFYDVRCVLQFGSGQQATTTDVKRGSSSPLWEGLEFAFPVEAWSDELKVTLVDASSKRHQQAEPLGTVTLRVIDLMSASRSSNPDASHGGGGGGGRGGGSAGGGGSHDAWHLAAESSGSSALQEIKQLSNSRATEADGELEIRVACEWRYSQKEHGGLQRQRSATQDSMGSAASGGALDAEEGAELREAAGVVEGMRTRMLAQDGYVDSLHACFHALKDEFALDYATLCARKLGTLSILVTRADDLPSVAAPTNSRRSHHHHADASGVPPDTMVALACGNQTASTSVVRRSASPSWREAFEFSITEETMELLLTVQRPGGSKAAEAAAGVDVGVVRVPIHPLLDQQPRIRREVLLPPASEQLPAGAAGRHGQQSQARRGRLTFEVRFRSALGVEAANGGQAEGERYERLLGLLRDEELWLPLAICETTPLERADRVASALVQLLTLSTPSMAPDHPASAASPAAMFEVRPMQQLLDLLRVVLFAELTETTQESLLFRRNSIATKLLTSALKVLGREYLQSTLEGPIRAACEAAIGGSGSGKGGSGGGSGGGGGSGAEGAPCLLEVDPSKLADGELDLNGSILEQRRLSLQAAAGRVLDAILSSASTMPSPIKHICQLLLRLTAERFGEGSAACWTGLSGILFLRILVPCIAAPSAFAILPSVPPRAASRGLTLISKVVNAVVNAATTGVAFHPDKEPYMLPLTSFVMENVEGTRAFLDEISQENEDEDEDKEDAHAYPDGGRGGRGVDGDGGGDGGEVAGPQELSALKEIHKALSEQADKVYETAPTPAALHAIQETLMDLGPADTKGGGFGGGGGDATSIAADWSPETVVARVVMVKEALLSQQHEPRTNTTAAATASASSSAPASTLILNASTNGGGDGVGGIVSASAMVANSPLLDRVKQARQSMAIPSKAGGGGGGGGSSSLNHPSGGRRLSLQLAASAVLQQNAAARGKASSFDLEREEAHRQLQAQAEELRQQLEKQQLDNDELRQKVAGYEASFKELTAEVL